MEKIEITNQNLKTYLEYELEKEENEQIYLEELDSITQITINGKSINGDTVYNVIYNNLDPKDAVNILMTRGKKEED